jgi:hypothetical protein
MATKFVSPGVFTQEIDQSYLAQGVAGIGAALIGTTKKGPAFVPTVVTDLNDFVSKFGDMDENKQMPYAAKNYLKNNNTLTVVRVLGHDDGTSTTPGFRRTVSAITTGVSGSALCVLHHSGSPSAVTITTLADDSTFGIDVVYNGAKVFMATASFLTSSANYVEKVLNTDPTLLATYGHYMYTNYKYSGSATGTWLLENIHDAENDYQMNCTSGSTSWVKSQLLGGNEFNLFRFHTHAHGKATNEDVKVTITNIKATPNAASTLYGTFDVVVRSFSDTDQRVSTLESFIGCTLDADSPNYILRRIGDGHEEFDTTQRKFVAYGTYPRKSQNIWVEMVSNTTVPKEALPWGFRGYRHLVFASASAVHDLPYTISQLDKNGNIDGNVRWGVSFMSGGIADRMRAKPKNVTSTAADADFTMTYLSATYNSQGRQLWYYNPSTPAHLLHSPVYASASLYGFTMPFEGGFDGWSDTVKDPIYLNNDDGDSTIGVVSLKRAIDTISNPDTVDINVVAVPGVHNLTVTDYTRIMVGNRSDVFYVMDVTGSSKTEAVQYVQQREIDDNYTACYYPDLKLNDKVNNKIVRVAPSVAMMGALAYNDRVGQVFFAPAGLNRGGLNQFDIVDTCDRLTFQDRDDLYSNRINPIATFPQEGIAVWGQKTLQVKPSALDRVNVRRLLIYAKKTCASAAKYLLFEPNTPQTWQRFLNTVNPILDKIRQDQGLVQFKVVMDSTVNTPDLIDRNIMTGVIFLRPTKAAEFIQLSFVITNSGVAFEE